MFGIPSIKFLTGIAVGAAAGYGAARYFECKAAGVPLKVAFTPSNLLRPVYDFPGILPPDPNRPKPLEMMTSYKPLFQLQPSGQAKAEAVAQMGVTPAHRAQRDNYTIGLQQPSGLEGDEDDLDDE